MPRMFVKDMMADIIYTINCTIRCIMSVAVANSPAGPYEFYGYVKHADGEKIWPEKGDSYNFDPGILLDQGHIYMYTGFAPNAEFPKIFQFFMKFVEQVFMGGRVEPGERYAYRKKPDISIDSGMKDAIGTSFEKHAF